MRKHKLLAILAPLTLLVMVLAACGGGGGGSGNANSGNLTIWAMGTEGDNLKVLANDFMKQNPNIHITVQSIPWSDAHSKLLTAVEGNQTPDIAQMGTTWMAEFAKTGALDTTPSSFNPSDFFQSAWNTTVYNGQSYGVPWYVDTRVLFYRTDIAQKAGITSPPQTWQQLLADAKAMQQKGGAKYGISLQSNDWEEWLPLVWQAGGRVYNNNQFTFNTSPVVQALAYYQQFFKQGLTPMTEPPNFDVAQGFVSGSTPMFISGPWEISLIQQEGGAAMNGKWAITTLPKDITNTSFAGGADMVVFKNSPNRAAAWKFVQYVTQPAVQQKWYETVSDLPAVKAAWSSGTLATNKYLTIFHDQLSDTKGPPTIVNWEQIANMIDDQMQQVMFGKMTPQQGAQTMQQKAQSIGTGS
ncbi:MAG TPA: sugar ABC transporter substrate-binding protein [Ktedonobacteraceae bacterium]|nr:sugar ABC transporter substrate-binding protein [Ktedonobacteraceae bacterium]